MISSVAEGATFRVDHSQGVLGGVSDVLPKPQLSGDSDCPRGGVGLMLAHLADSLPPDNCYESFSLIQGKVRAGNSGTRSSPPPHKEDAVVGGGTYNSVGCEEVGPWLVASARGPLGTSSLTRHWLEHMHGPARSQDRGSCPSGQLPGCSFLQSLHSAIHLALPPVRRGLVTAEQPSSKSLIPTNCPAGPLPAGHADTHLTAGPSRSCTLGACESSPSQRRPLSGSVRGFHSVAG